MYIYVVYNGPGCRHEKIGFFARADGFNGAEFREGEQEIDPLNAKLFENGFVSVKVSPMLGLFGSHIYIAKWMDHVCGVFFVIRCVSELRIFQ